MEKINNSTLDLLMDIAGGMAVYDDVVKSDREKSDDIHVSEKTKKKIIREINTIEKETHESTRLYRSVKKAAAVALIICTAGFAILLSMEPVRAAFVSTVYNWYGDHIGIMFNSGGSSLELDKPLMPGYVPDMWEYEISADRYSSSLYLHSDEGERIYITKTVNNNSELLFIDDDYTSSETVTLDSGIEGTLYTYVDKYIFIYEDDYVYNAVGNCSTQTLLKVLNNLDS